MLVLCLLVTGWQLSADSRKAALQTVARSVTPELVEVGAEAVRTVALTATATDPALGGSLLPEVPARVEPLPEPEAAPVAPEPEPARFTTLPAAARVERLLFCNQPERLAQSGIYAEAMLPAGQETRVFFHYRNTTRASAPLVVAFYGSAGVPLHLEVRKGIAQPESEPPIAGRQAMARYLKAPTTSYIGQKGYARFSLPLGYWEVGSGVISVRPVGQDVTLRIYFKDARRTVPGMQVTEVLSPRRERDIELTEEQTRGFTRIGEPEESLRSGMDGTYGIMYGIRVLAPEGKRVRVLFSPRGGHAGLAGLWNGAMRQSRIVPAAHWAVFAEAVAGPNGLVLWTVPFGGVYYPVELAFQIVE